MEERKDFNMEDLFMSEDDFDSIEGLDEFITTDEDDSDPESVVGDDETVVTSSDGGDSDEDDEEHEEQTDDENDEDEDENKDTSSLNLYSSLAKVLFDEGVTPHLNLEETKIESAEDLVKAIQNEIKSSEFSDLNETQKEYLEALRAGVPESDIRESLDIDSMLDEITEDQIEENEELRKDLISQYYIARGLTEKEANRFAERSVSMAEDIDDAKTSLEALKQLNQAKKQENITKATQDRENAAKEYEKSMNSLKEKVTNIEELIPTSTLDPKGKSDLLKLITSPAGEVNGQQVNEIFKYLNENPIEGNIKIAYLYKITNGFKDFDKLITKKATSKASRDLERILRSGKNNPSFQVSDDTDSFGIDSNPNDWDFA